MRGTDQVDDELNDILANICGMHANNMMHSCRTLFSRRNAKQAAAAILIPFFQQFTGMNAIMYALALDVLSLSWPEKVLIT